MENIILPLKQHVGGPCQPIVKVGDHVDRGQLIAVPNGLGANLHASYSGEITAIDDANIEIHLDDIQDLDNYVKIPDTDTNIEAIEAAGVVGAGGAGFPTHIKLKTEIPGGTFLINAVECEALLSHNIEQVTKHLDQLIRGIKYCLEITKAKKAVIAVKAKHRQLIVQMLKALKDEDSIGVFKMEDLYPTGDERVIIREVLGTPPKPGQLPSELNAAVCNVETIKHIVEAIENRKPAIDKDVSVSGRVQQKETVFANVPIGTRVKELINHVGGYVEPHGEIVLGGPMTGTSGKEDSPIIKTTGGVLVAMPFPQEKRKVGLLVCECGGSEERMTEIAESMGAEVVASEMCKRMVEVNGRYRCALPGICPGQAQTVMNLKKQGAEVVMTGSCSD